MTAPSRCSRMMRGHTGTKACVTSPSASSRSAGACSNGASRRGFGFTRLGLPGTPWLGATPIDGKTILVHAEQGFGDSIQMSRYLPLLGARATVILDVPRPLRRLLGGIPGVARVISSDEATPLVDAWIPMLSLPLAFGSMLASIPSRMPYLTVDPEQTARWRA